MQMDIPKLFVKHIRNEDLHSSFRWFHQFVKHDEPCNSGRCDAVYLFHIENDFVEGFAFSYIIEGLCERDDALIIDIARNTDNYWIVKLIDIDLHPYPHSSWIYLFPVDKTGSQNHVFIILSKYKNKDKKPF